MESGRGKIILGVAFGWSERKGLDVFVKLAKQMSEDWKIVLVGINEELVQKLPDNIIPIPRIGDAAELAAIYTAADVFFSPTREEVLGMVNIEALACGTPVVTFDTGGSPECIDETVGYVVNGEELKQVIYYINRICNENEFSWKICRKHVGYFNNQSIYKEYIELYEK